MVCAIEDCRMHDSAKSRRESPVRPTGSMIKDWSKWIRMLGNVKKEEVKKS